VAGGGQIYTEAMPWAQRMILTEVDSSPDGDTWFPEWVAEDWREMDRLTYDGFAIVTYERA